MTSDHESFFTLDSFAVVGHSAKRPFARLTYGGLKRARKPVFPVDPSRENIEGDRAYPDLASLPRTVSGVVLEVPAEETVEWVKKAADLGVKELWIHQGTDTPEALDTARQHGMRVRSGGCAVMYLTRGLSVHGVHRLIWKLLGKY